MVINKRVKRQEYLPRLLVSATWSLRAAASDAASPARSAALSTLGRKSPSSAATALAVASSRCSISLTVTRRAGALGSMKPLAKPLESSSACPPEGAVGPDAKEPPVTASSTSSTTRPT